MSALVEMRGVGMTYGSGEAAVTALSDVSLDIRRGGNPDADGALGLGKTTLLQIAGALLAPTAGEVRLMGASIAGLSQDKRGALRLAHFGFVFQSYNLFPTLTARQNVELALDLRGTAAADRIERASAALARVGLGDRADHYPAQLSGGQKQRVAIARALAGAPDVVFADEPTAALDSESGKRVVALLHDLAKAQNRAVVVVTHDPRIVDAADRIVHIEDGRIGRVEARATVEA